MKDEYVELTEDDESCLEFVKGFNSKQLTKEVEFLINRANEYKDSFDGEKEVSSYYMEKFNDGIKIIVHLKRRIKYLESIVNETQGE